MREHETARPAPADIWAGAPAPAAAAEEADGAVPRLALAGGAVDRGTRDARGELLGPLVSSEEESLRTGLGGGRPIGAGAAGAAVTAAGPAAPRAATSGPARPKKSATPEEVKEIQRLIDQAKQDERAAAQMEKEAAALKKGGDHPGALAKGREAWARRLQARRAKQDAINKAVSAYDIDISHAKKLLYDPTIQDAETSEDGEIGIGDAMFTDAACLASTIGHEAEVHVNQQVRKGRNYSGRQGVALNEIEAYDYEIRSAARFGTTKDQVAGLRRNREHYMQGLSDEYRQRARAGIYTLKPGDEEK